MQFVEYEKVSTQSILQAIPACMPSSAVARNHQAVDSKEQSRTWAALGYPRTPILLGAPYRFVKDVGMRTQGMIVRSKPATIEIKSVEPGFLVDSTANLSSLSSSTSSQSDIDEASRRRKLSLKSLCRTRSPCP